MKIIQACKVILKDNDPFSAQWIYIILFTIGQTDDHAKNETSEQYFLNCFLYTFERQTLFNLFENVVPHFPQITKKEKYHILTRGINIHDLD